MVVPYGLLMNYNIISNTKKNTMRLFLFIIATCCLQFGCQTRDKAYQEILDQLEGEYYLSRADYVSSKDTDSMVYDLGRMTFDKCKVQVNFSSEGCYGDYEIQEETGDFIFQLVGQEELTLHFNPHEEIFPFGISDKTVDFYFEQNNLIIELIDRDRLLELKNDKVPYQLILSR